MSDEKLIQHLDQYLFKFSKIKKQAWEDWHKSQSNCDKKRKLYDDILHKYNFLESAMERLEGKMCWKYDCHMDMVCDNVDCPIYKEYQEEMDELNK